MSFRRIWLLLLLSELAWFGFLFWAADRWLGPWLA